MILCKVHSRYVKRLTVRKNTAKDPVLCQPGLEHHAHSGEMLIARHL